MSKFYDVPGSNPYQNTIDPAVTGAIINLTQANQQYVFKDSTIARQDTSRYKTPVNFYYLKDFSLEQGRQITIEAVLPNGKILSAETNAPNDFRFDNAAQTRIIPPEIGDDIMIQWLVGEEGLMFDAKLELVYYKTENGSDVRHTMEIPLEFNGDTPVYPLPIFETGIVYNLPSFTRIMQEISKNDANKADYKIADAFFTIVVYDKNLTGYFAALTFIDELSIRIDEIDFTNIVGGFGVFGSYLVYYKEISLDPGYITSFGYRVKN